MLQVQILDQKATLPSIANPGEDLGYDLYALEDITVRAGAVAKVRTGLAMTFVKGDTPFGLLIRDRSSMAAKGLAVTAGVVDAGYRGEIMVLMNFISPEGIREKRVPGQLPKLEKRTLQDGSVSIGPPGADEMHGEYSIKAGDKIAQILPFALEADTVEEKAILPTSKRKEAGFGSSGK